MDKTKSSGSRGAIVKKNIIGSVLIKGAAVVVGVLTIRSYMSFFGDYRVLGVWYALLSVLTWILNFDLGIGNGLRNLLAGALSKGKMSEGRELISTAYASLGAVCCSLIVATGVIVYFVDWNVFFNIDQEVLESLVLRATVAISLVGIIIQLYLKIVASVLNSMEKTAVTNGIALLTNVVVLVFVSVFSFKTDVDSLLFLSCAYFIAAVVPYCVASLYVFCVAHKDLRPSLRCVNVSRAKDIVSLGGQFLFVQITLMAITATNELYISWIYGTADVVPFQAYNKVFSTLLAFFAIAASPVWSAVARAWSDDDRPWIIRAFKKLNVYAAFGCVFVLIVCIPLQTIFDIWLGAGTVKATNSATLSFASYTAVMFFAYSSAAIANGMSLLRVQMVCYLLGFVLKYPICLLLSGCIPEWSAVVFSNVLIMAPYALIQPVSLRRALKRDKDE